MNTLSRASLLFCLFALSFNLPADEPAPDTSFINKTDTSTTGYDAGLKISFSSQSVDNGKTVLIDIRLKNKRITSRFDDVTDPDKRTFEIKVVNVKTGRVTNLSAKELGELNVLKSTIGPATTLAHSFLAKTLELALSNDPDGENIDWSTQKVKEELEKIKKEEMQINAITPQVFASLCLNLGQTMAGRYTRKIRGRQQTFVEQAVVGPCHSGECLGRCGAGCGDEQSYTQDCCHCRM